jgi:hypothetical protein
MEHLTRPVRAAVTTSAPTQLSTKSTALNLSAERDTAWTDILTESSFALGKEPLTGRALDAAKAAFERINARVPTRLLPTMYVKSMELRDKSGAPVYWDARAISLAYDEYLTEREGRQDDEKEPSDLGPCEHCGFGVREDVTERTSEKWIPSADKGVTLPCAVCRPRACAEAWRQYCERNPQTVPANLIAEVVQAGKQLLGEDLVCGSCRRKVNTYLSRKRAGDKCGELLNRFSSDAGDDDDPELCDGALEKS